MGGKRKDAPNYVSFNKKRKGGKKTGVSVGMGALNALKMLKSSSAIPQSIKNKLALRGNTSGQGERKFFDTYTNGDNTAITNVGVSVFQTTAPATNTIHAVTQGAGESQRVGREIQIDAIQFNANLIMGVEAPATIWGGSMDLYCILDTQCNGTACTSTDIWALYLGIAGTGNVPINTSFLNLSNSDRFKILKKWTYDFNQAYPYYNGTNLGRVNQTIKISEYLKCDIKVKFKVGNTTGAVGGTQDNAVYFFAFSDFDSTGKLNVSDPVARIRYRD